MIILPEGSNIPVKWIIHDDAVRMVVVLPSRTVPGKVYNVTIDKRTRMVSCDCPGWEYRGYCHHTSGLVWMCYKAAKTKGVQDTSLAAFHAFSAEELGEKQQAVYYEIARHGPGSNREIAERMHLPINTITPRVKELRDMGVVMDSGKKHDDVTDQEVHVWMAVPGLEKWRGE